MRDRWHLRPPPGARIVDTGRARWWRDGDLIFNQSYAEEVTAAQIRAGLKGALELAEGRRLPLVAESGPLSGATHEARAVLAGSEAAEALAAMAVLVGSPVARMVMNVFTGLMSPRLSVRLFTDVAAARAWASEQPHG